MGAAGNQPSLPHRCPSVAAGAGPPTRLSFPQLPRCPLRPQGEAVTVSSCSAGRRGMDGGAFPLRGSQGWLNSKLQALRGPSLSLNRTRPTPGLLRGWMERIRWLGEKRRAPEEVKVKSLLKQDFLSWVHPVLRQRRGEVRGPAPSWGLLLPEETKDVKVQLKVPRQCIFPRL